MKKVLIVLSLCMLAACTQQSPQQAEPAVKPAVSQDIKQEADIKVTVEGMEETRKGTLAKSPQGYNIYTLPGFKFTPEEPNKDMVFSEKFPGYFIRIEKLDAKADTAALKQQALEELNLNGVPKEVNVPDLKDISVWSLQANSDKLSKMITVVKKGNMLVKCSLYIPNGEPAEGFYPSMIAMIKSIN